MKAEFELQVKRAEYCFQVLGIRSCVARVNGSPMAMLTHIAKDHKYFIYCETI